MIAVVLALLAVIGLMAPWPIVDGKVWKDITSLNVDFVLKTSIGARLNAFKQPDGWILIVGVLILLFTLLLRSTSFVINLRRFVIGVLLLFYTAEMGFYISQDGFNINNMGGLIFSWIFLLLAFVSSLLKIGKVGFNTHTTALKEASTYIQNIRRGIKWVYKLIDKDTGEIIREGEIKEEHTLRVGRDYKWANVVVPKNYRYVSRRHLSIDVLDDNRSTSINVSRIGMRYSALVNGKLFNPKKESFVISSVPATIELVATYGPILKINIQSYRRDTIALAKAAANRWKRAQSALKAITLLTAMAIILGGSIMWSSANNLISDFRRYEQQIENQRKQISQIKSNLSNIQDSLIRVNKKIIKISRKLRRSERRLMKLSRTLDSLRKLNQKRAQLIQEMEATVDKLTIQSQFRSIFPIVYNCKGKLGFMGTGWIGKRKNKYYFVTAAHVYKVMYYRVKNGCEVGILIFLDTRRIFTFVPLEVEGVFNVVNTQDVAYAPVYSTLGSDYVEYLKESFPDIIPTIVERGENIQLGDTTLILNDSTLRDGIIPTAYIGFPSGLSIRMSEEGEIKYIGNAVGGIGVCVRYSPIEQIGDITVNDVLECSHISTPGASGSVFFTVGFQAIGLLSGGEIIGSRNTLFSIFAPNTFGGGI